MPYSPTALQPYSPTALQPYSPTALLGSAISVCSGSFSTGGRSQCCVPVRVIFQCWLCSSRWCGWQSSTPSARLVSPLSVSQSLMWWASVQAGDRSQSTHRHPPSRTPIAARCFSVKSRSSRPTLMIWPMSSNLMPRVPVSQSNRSMVSCEMGTGLPSICP
ncbi:hypothetical protein E3O47_02000 [Cryobacterium sp. TMT2-17-1]|nr:hypothetical protein E3O47_02000 [Cryobacterium sp. TMT2-17-1]